jgi:amino acid adenylation domain-containing protein
MDIQEVLRRCIDSQIKLTVVNGGLRVHYEGSQPDPALLSLLRENRSALLRHLDLLASASGDIISRIAAVDGERIVASRAQRRMVLLDQIDRTTAPYNMVGAYILRGKLDWRALEDSLNEVIGRHEALRSHYETVEGDVWQIVDPPFELVWSRAEISSKNEAVRELAIREVIRRENAWRFDLGTGPLIRASSLRLDIDVEVLVLNVHHIACDGWSIDIIKRELADLYRIRLSGVATTVSRPTVQYVDYSEWARHAIHSDRLQEQFNYWVDQLDGIPQLHSLPLDFPRPPKQTYAGSKIYSFVARDKLASAKQACQANDVTLFMYLQTALAAVLCVYAYERDIVMGFPVAGRQHDDLAGTVGLFVNTLVLRNRVEGNPTFAQMLQKHKTVILEALGNQDVPFDALVERLSISRSRAYSPLVQIVFSLQSQIETRFVLEGIETVAINNEDEPVKFDLQIFAQEADGQLQVEWHFNRDLFSQASVTRLANSFSSVLELLDEHLNTPIFSLPMARPETPDIPESREAIPNQNRRIDTLFEYSAKYFPDRVAVAFGETELRYRELDELATRVACRLNALGVGRGSIVGLCAERSLEMIVGMLGALKAGAAYLPMDPVHPLQRLHMIYRDSGAKVLLTQRKLRHGFHDVQALCLMLDDDENQLSVDASNIPNVSYSVDDPAYVIYTSGTTGIPKGVVVSHAGFENLLRHMDEMAPLGGDWTGSLWSSISFDASVYEIFSVLCRGGTLQIVPDDVRLDPERLFKWMDLRKVTSTFMHAGYLEPYAGYLQQQSASRALRRMMVGAEVIPVSQVASIVRQSPELRVVNAYGPTEATICSTLYACEPSTLTEDGHVPIGHAVRGMTLRVMTMAGEPAPNGAVGELYVGGVGVALGYLNRPELNETKFVVCLDGPFEKRFYRTGDLVRRRADGAFEFVGRKDEQVKIRGFRVELGEVEARLCQLPEISDAVVLAWGQGMHRQLVAYVVLKRASIGYVEESGEVGGLIRRDLLTVLPDYMVPAYVMVIERIPVTTNGKVDREALPSPTQYFVTPIETPRNEIEERLLAIWKNVLGVESLGINDDFFERGGQSLLATRVVSSVRSTFSISQELVSLGDVLENPTVEAFARSLGAILSEAVARQKVMHLEMLGEKLEEGFL